MLQPDTPTSEAMKRIVLISISGMLLGGGIAESPLCELSPSYPTYPQILLAFAYVALLSGTIAGLVAPHPLGLARLFVSWFPAAGLFMLLITGNLSFQFRGLQAWQFTCFYPVVVAALGALASSMAATARREKRYTRFLSIALIAVILWGEMRLIDFLQRGQ
jgi:hypothetical protein